MKKILILGGTGYLGLNIASSLSLFCSVTVTGRNYLHSNVFNFLQEKNINFEQVSILNLRRIFSMIDKNDCIIVAIPNTQPHQPKKKFHSDFLKIILPTKRIFKYASKRNKKVIFLSSGGSVYGEGGSYSHREFSNPNPITKYGKYKLLLENYLLSINHTNSSKNVILRIANPYGGTFNDTYHQGFINSVIRNIKAGKIVEIWGDGYQIRDFVYIEDLVKLVALVIDDNITGIFNCGSGEGYTLNEIIYMIQNIIGMKIEVKFNYSYREKIKSNVLSIKKANEYLDWYPSLSINEALIKLLKHS